MDLTHVRFSGTVVPARARKSPSQVRPTDDGLETVSGLPAAILAHVGLDPRHYRVPPLARRAPACMRLLRVGTEAEAMTRLSATPALAHVALNALLIGFTEFFRDKDVFHALRDHVIPRLRALNRPVRVLSVGCSAGHELYSMAMLLEEHDLLKDATLTGLDCRPDAIDMARRGVFAEDQLEDLPAHLRARYVTSTADGGRIVPHVSDRLSWSVADATASCPDGPWDLILCRNLLIYIKPHLSSVMMTRMLDQLAPNGVLMLGKAERPAPSLRLVCLSRCLYARHSL